MVKRGAALVLVLIFLVPFVCAGEQWMYSSETIEMGLEIGSTLTITPQTSSFQIETLTANLSFMPLESFQQEVNDLDFTPAAFDNGDHAVFVWEKPTGLNFDYGLTANLKNTNVIPQIKKKIPFPIKNLDPQYDTYLAEQDIIDFSDPSINKVASELVAGEDDLYMAVFNIADWVMDEVEYDLSNSNVATGTKTASWVIRNRVGVCDEMTTLFMAMVRSVGVPARYVSGLAYTNQNGLNDWGPHAWAEVYFPGAGWIPYDVTYGEVGFVDATHIKLMESLDADESSTSYSWRGRSIDLKAEDLGLAVDLLGKSGTVQQPVTLSAEFMKEKAGFGSYNLLAVEVTNKLPFYVATEVALSQTLEVDIEDHRKYVAIGPNNKKTLYYMIRISDDLDKGYLYTIPSVAYTTRNVTTKTEFTATKNFPVFKRSDIQTLMTNLMDEGSKSYSKDLSIKCSTTKEQFLIYETIPYTCTLKNQGNVALDQLEVCMEEECRVLDLGVGQKTSVEFQKQFLETGDKELLVSAKNSMVTRYDNEYIKVLDETVVGIEDIQYPSDVRFSEDFEISFLVERKSQSIPVDVDIRIEADGFSKDWEVNSMDANQKFIIRVKGKNFKQGANDVRILVDYKDENGKKNHVEKTFQIKLTSVTFFQKLLIKMYAFENWAMGIFG